MMLHIKSYVEQQDNLHKPSKNQDSVSYSDPARFNHVAERQ